MGTKNRSVMPPFDDATNEFAPGPKGPGAVDADELERLTAQGYPAATVRNIHLEINRDDFGRLLQFLEERAVRTDHYLEVRQAVLFSEMLRAQARTQGY